MRVITVEEHFEHAKSADRVAKLSAEARTAGTAGSFAMPAVPRNQVAEQLAGARLEHMDRAGIDVQVVSIAVHAPGALDHPEAVELCRRANDDLALQISRNPTRFRGFATIPLHDPVAAADELKRCVGEFGFVGALTSGTCGGVFLDDERFEPVLSAAESVDLPIYVHPGIPPQSVNAAYYTGNWSPDIQFLLATGAFGWHAEAGLHILRLILSKALDRHPNLKLLSGHWGEFIAGWLDRLDECIGRTGQLDRPFSHYYRDHVWVTPSGLYNQNRLQFIVGEVGAERIVHSADYPYRERDDAARFLSEAKLTNRQRECIAHRNAEQLLRI